MSGEATEPGILSAIEGHVATITISNIQRRNAFTSAMLARIPVIFQELDQLPQVRVIVVQGAGEVAFASGDDITEFEALRSTPADEALFMAKAMLAFNAPAACSKPVVAAINGFCFGGGMQLAAACDIRICGEDARFAIPATKLGISYPMEGIARFVNLVGPAQTARIFITGDVFTCVQLAASGFVTEMVPAGQVRSAAQVYASTIASRAPLAVRAHKRSIAACANGDAEQLRAALELIAQCPLSADFVEGRTAFMQKRKAEFTGT
jgi:enoyl-CoA hydratase/carnithine racemase